MKILKRVLIIVGIVLLVLVVGWKAFVKFVAEPAFSRARDTQRKVELELFQKELTTYYENKHAYPLKAGQTIILSNEEMQKLNPPNDIPYFIEFHLDDPKLPKKENWPPAVYTQSTETEYTLYTRLENEPGGDYVIANGAGHKRVSFPVNGQTYEYNYWLTNIK
jgi:hypothetical protein